MFFSDIAHGVTRFDLFLFEPSTSGYTCDYVDGDGGAYPTVRAALNQLGSFEDIVQAGAVQTAAVAILYSETTDIFLETGGTYGSALRSMYIALKHAQMPVDVLIEEDCAAGRLHYYDVLYVAMPHVNDAAAKGIAAWVAAGGTVYFFGGAGFRNQDNQTGVVLETLMGIKQKPVAVTTGSQDAFNASIGLIKQDIKFVDQLDTVTFSSNITMYSSTTGLLQSSNASSDMVVKGVKSLFELAADEAVQAGVEVLGSFNDGSPAVRNRDLSTVHCV